MLCNQDLRSHHAIPYHGTLERYGMKKKVYMKDFLSQHCQRVCLTTDTWASPQNQSYMCLTTHFIDND